MRLRVREYIWIVMLLLCPTAVWAGDNIPGVYSTMKERTNSTEEQKTSQITDSIQTNTTNNTPADSSQVDSARGDNTTAQGKETTQAQDTIAAPRKKTTQAQDTIASQGFADSGDSAQGKGAMSWLEKDSMWTRGMDTMPWQRIDTVEPKKKSTLSAPIHYQSKDSMVMMANGTAYLHGQGELKYERMELQSDYIRMNMDSNQIYARGVYDTLNYEWKGKPVFKDGNDTYETNEITYNIKTQKGYIRHVVTQQGEGYIIADKTKKSEGDEMMIAGGQYTTCDQHEHPHFYLKMTKAKVKPGEYIATGPAYMVVGDVPLPLAIPFGFFPFTNKYSSGIIMPTFGDDYSRGLYLSNFGYYFALCDYADLEVTGDIYTRGTWAVRAKTRYIWRYHFSGNLSINYRNDVTSEKGLPDYSARRNFSVQWTHNQDSKANPYSSFSASVNFATSGYNRSNINSYYNPNLYSENTKSSTINYTQRFPDSPWSLSMTASLTQRTSDSTISLTAPQLTANMSTIYPFKLWHQATLKRKGKVGGKEKWYEKISMSYSLNGKISCSNMKESYFLHSDFLRDWTTGMSHTVPIKASFMLFKYLSITPSINLRDRMYFTRVDRRWDEEAQALALDTTNGFYNVFDFDVGASMSTKIYGFYTPLKKLFPKGKVEKFRHVLTPSIGISYHPDFEKSFWGYYGSYDQPVYSGTDSITGKKIQKVDDEGNPVYQHNVYSRFANAPYGNAARGMSATLNFGLEQNLEMKMVNSKDTTGKNPYKVVSIIDKFSVTGGYNFAVDSMNWSLFNVNLRLKFPYLNNYSLNLNTQLDPYMYELNSSGQPVRTNKQYWHNGKFPHWNGLRWNFSYTISNQTIKKWKEKLEGKKTTKSEEQEEDMDAIEKDEEGMDRNAKNNKKSEEEVDDGYVKTEIPWSLSLNYSLSYAPTNKFDYEKMYYEMKFSHYLSLSGNIGLGRGWKVSANLTYNFDYKKVTACTINVSRDLHCWNMTASINPIGPFKSYTFHIGVNASMLADLKYDKSGNSSSDSNVTWW